MRLALWLALLAALTVEAGAHSWYSGTGCCSGDECEEAPQGSVGAGPKGYRVVLTAAQAQAIYPNALGPVDAIVPFAQIRPSRDANFHVCLYSGAADKLTENVRCLFVPMTSMIDHDGPWL